MDEPVLILSGVSSRYLLGEGTVQEALFMNNQTGEEYSLGLVRGQYEDLLAILKANYGDLSPSEGHESDVSSREGPPSAEPLPDRNDRPRPSGVPSPTRRDTEERLRRETEADGYATENDEEDGVDYAGSEEIRAALSGRL